MNKIKEITRKYNIKPIKYTIKQNAYIIKDNKSTYVLKKRKLSRNTNEIDNIYTYLDTRSFNYYPKLINVLDDYDMYEYIEDIKTPDEQKAIDIIHMMSLLHNKTTFYREVSIDNFKERYETIKKQIEELQREYINTIEYIETKKYMSPSEYHLARNISIVFKAIDFCKYYLEEWYKIVSKKTKERLVTIHNNLKVEHILENKMPYLISWNNSKIDIPIYDFYKFYKNHYMDFDFEELYNLYISKYPLLKEEKILLFILLAMPPKIEFKDDEMKNCIEVNKVLEYIFKTEKLIKPNTLNQTSKE